MVVVAQTDRPGRPAAAAARAPGQKEAFGGAAAGHSPRMHERAVPARGRTTSGPECDQEINHVGLFHLLARRNLDQPVTLIGEKCLAVSLFKDEECRPAADVGEMHVQGDTAAPAHLTARNP